jgi:hypothetical protein
VPDRTWDVLRVDPQAIPVLCAEFANALSTLGQAMFELGNRGYMPEAWLGDEVSTEVAEHYTRRAMDQTDSSYAALRQYEAELVRIHDTLQQMEDSYRRTEGDNAARWGRLA